MARYSAPNKEALSFLIRAACGDQPMAAMAESCGITRSAFSKIINRKFSRPLALDFLEAVAEHAASGSNVTLEKLIAANEGQDIELAKPESIMSRPVGGTNPTVFPLVNYFTAELEKVMTYNSSAKIPVSPFRYKCGPYNLILSFEDIPDLVFGFYQEKSSYPSFEIGFDEINSSLQSLFLMDLWEPHLLAGQHTTFAFFSQSYYAKFKSMYAAVTVNNYISLLLVDYQTLRIVEETQLPRKDGTVVESIYPTVYRASSDESNVIEPTESQSAV